MTTTIYPDPITPICDPVKLQDATYDPHGLMPRELPQHPRVFMSAEQLAATRHNIKRHAWAQAALKRLLEACKQQEPLPKELPTPADFELNNGLAKLTVRNALAALLTGEKIYRDFATQAMRLFAEGYARWTFKGAGDSFAAHGALEESRFNRNLGWTFDLLAAGDRLDDNDRERFLAMLASTEKQMDANAHAFCGNHNSWSLSGRLAVAGARGNMQSIHDALYGCDHGRGWRYGIIHQLRHDVLSDGMHWEGTLGYQFYTLMALTDIADYMTNLGQNLWNAQLQPLQQTDGHDLHRAYGPLLGRKCLKAAFDAPFYQMFPNYEVSLLHDSGLGHLRGVWIWGIIYNKVWEAYGDPKYAWLLTLMEKEYPASARQYPELPMPLNTHSGDLDFARIRDWPPPKGRFSFKRNTSISLVGKHENACSLFPAHGSAMLRSNAEDPNASAAFIYWGPHVAGHMGPAALHVDFMARAKRLTDAPHSGGYGDNKHLTWSRATPAHNTITIDEKSMFPYDFDTQSIWECDRWRDRTSDGRLVFFLAKKHFKAIRAVNESVYPDTRLDRTVVITPHLILDVFRAVSLSDHVFDWAVHVPGKVPKLPGAMSFDPGKRRGYCHLTEAWATPPGNDAWTVQTDAAAIRILAPSGGRLISACDPSKTQQLGDLNKEVEPRSTIMVRCQGSSALFISLWSPEPGSEPSLSLLAGNAEKQLTLETVVTGLKARWIIPALEKPVRIQNLP